MMHRLESKPHRHRHAVDFSGSFPTSGAAGIGHVTPPSFRIGSRNAPDPWGNAPPVPDRKRAVIFQASASLSAGSRTFSRTGVPSARRRRGYTHAAQGNSPGRYRRPRSTPGLHTGRFIVALAGEGKRSAAA